MSWSTERAAKGQRYVCAACGRTTDPGGKRTDLRDSSCIMHAVLVEAEKHPEGYWVTAKRPGEDPKKAKEGV